MPLPPALAARLKKRGIVTAEADEEVIAESYDDESKKKVTDINRNAGALGCPNKYNPYHMCVEYCYEHWGDGMAETRLSREYMRKRSRMLQNYPLPPGWKEVYDAGVHRHYYWSAETDEVCWISPKHPRAVIGEAAPKMAKLAFEKLYNVETAMRSDLIRATAAPTDKAGERRQEKFNRGRHKSPTPSDESSDDDDRGQLKRQKPNRKKDPHLDPMDPASYSNISRGKWTSGLERGDEAKTGVDTTATGPLFQMRPYPAPGAILKKKQEAEKKAKKRKK